MITKTFHKVFSIKKRGVKFIVYQHAAEAVYKIVIKSEQWMTETELVMGYDNVQKLLGEVILKRFED